MRVRRHSGLSRTATGKNTARPLVVTIVNTLRAVMAIAAVSQRYDESLNGIIVKGFKAHCAG